MELEYLKRLGIRYDNNRKIYTINNLTDEMVQNAYINQLQYMYVGLEIEKHKRVRDITKKEKEIIETLKEERKKQLEERLNALQRNNR